MMMAHLLNLSLSATLHLLACFPRLFTVATLRLMAHLLSLFVFAALRLIAVLVCFEVSISLSVEKPNYPDCPWWFRWSMAALGAVFAGNCADLIFRGLHSPAGQPLLSGYALSLAAGTAAVAGHFLLALHYRPAASADNDRWRGRRWRGMTPCLRRRLILRERARSAAIATPAAAQTNGQFQAEHGPIYDGMDSVIPDALRSAE